jgi:DNA-binding NarL/FixJ family response regulator
MRVLLVDDHGIVREGTALLLKSIDPSIEIAHARTAAECMAQVAAGRFDLVLLDLELPDRPGVEALSELKRNYPELPVVVLSGHEDRDSVLESIKQGAMGFIPKSAENPELLAHALKLAVSGAVTVPVSVFARNAGATYSPSSARPTSQASSDRPTKPQDLGITARQLDVLRLVVQGLPNKLIARRLDIAETTARGYVSELLAAFGVANRTQLVVEVARRGLVLGTAGTQSS